MSYQLNKEEINEPINFEINYEDPEQLEFLRQQLNNIYSNSNQDGIYIKKHARKHNNKQNKVNQNNSDYMVQLELQENNKNKEQAKQQGLIMQYLKQRYNDKVKNIKQAKEILHQPTQLSPLIQSCFLANINNQSQNETQMMTTNEQKGGINKINYAQEKLEKISLLTGCQDINNILMPSYQNVNMEQSQIQSQLKKQLQQNKILMESPKIYQRDDQLQVSDLEYSPPNELDKDQNSSKANQKQVNFRKSDPTDERPRLLQNNNLHSSLPYGTNKILLTTNDILSKTLAFRQKMQGKYKKSIRERTEQMTQFGLYLRSNPLFNADPYNSVLMHYTNKFNAPNLKQIHCNYIQDDINYTGKHPIRLKAHIQDEDQFQDKFQENYFYPKTKIMSKYPVKFAKPTDGITINEIFNRKNEKVKVIKARARTENNSLITEQDESVQQSQQKQQFNIDQQYIDQKGPLYLDRNSRISCIMSQQKQYQNKINQLSKLNNQLINHNHTHKQLDQRAQFREMCKKNLELTANKMQYQQQQQLHSSSKVLNTKTQISTQLKTETYPNTSLMNQNAESNNANTEEDEILNRLRKAKNFSFINLDENEWKNNL